MESCIECTESSATTECGCNGVTFFAGQTSQRSTANTSANHRNKNSSSTFDWSLKTASRNSISKSLSACRSAFSSSNAFSCA